MKLSIIFISTAFCIGGLELLNPFRWKSGTYSSIYGSNGEVAKSEEAANIAAANRAATIQAATAQKNYEMGLKNAAGSTGYFSSAYNAMKFW